MSELPMIRSLPGYPWLPEAEAARRDKARIAELEAENGTLNGQADRDKQTIIRLGFRIAELEAERDRLKAALAEAADWISSDYDIATAKDLPLTRAALSGEGVTECR